MDQSLLFGLPRDLVEKIAANLGLSLVAILFLLLVARPLVKRIVESGTKIINFGARYDLVAPARLESDGDAFPIALKMDRGTGETFALCRDRTRTQFVWIRLN